MTYISDRGPYMPILKDKLLDKIAISSYNFVVIGIDYNSKFNKLKMQEQLLWNVNQVENELLWLFSMGPHRRWFTNSENGCT